MLLFEVNQRYVRVSGDGMFIARLRNHLSVEVANAYFRKRYTPGWDGRTSFYDHRNNAFSRGLLPHVIEWTKRSRIEYRVYKNYSVLPRDIATDDLLIDTKLRDDQIQPVQAWLENGGVGTIWFPTGGGKTLLSAAIIKSLFKRKLIRRALFMVTGLSILKQAASEFKKHGINYGMLGDDSIDLNHPVVIGSVQSLHRKIDRKHRDSSTIRNFLAEVDLLISDETHHSRSRQIKTVVNHTCNAKYCLGLSGSPFQKYHSTDLQEMVAEDVSVLAAVGPVVAHVQTSKLVDAGNLAKPVIYMFPVICRESTLNWPKSREAFLFENESLHHQIKYMVKQAADAKCPTLVIAGSNVKYAKELNRVIESAKIKSVCLTGSTDADDREIVRKEINNALQSAPDCIVATTIFDEGLDLPDIRQVIIASGGLSTVKTIQRIGRGLRKKMKGENKVAVIDLMFYGNRYLHKHSLARLKQYLSEPSYELVLVGDKDPAGSFSPLYHSPLVYSLVDGRARYSQTIPQTEFFREMLG